MKKKIENFINEKPSNLFDPNMLMIDSLVFIETHYI